MEKGKKILYLITKSNWGGAQRYVYDLATHLVTRSPSESLEAVVAVGGSGPLVEKLLDKNIRVIPLPDAQRDIAIFKEAKLLMRLFKIIKNEKPDVLHVNSSKLAGLGALAGFVLRTFYFLPSTFKIIFTAHGWPFNEDRPWWQKVLIYKFSWLTSLFANITVTITKSDFEQGKRMPFVGHKMRMVHNAIEQIDFYDRKIAREKLGLKQDELVVGTIAELTPNKGLTYLAGAANECPGAKFVVIGDGEQRHELATTRLNLVGFVPEANRYLVAFDIFVLPSIKEGLPYTLLEAAQAGLPVVASNIGGVPDIIGNSGLMVPAKNSELLAKAISSLISNPKLRAELGSQLRDKTNELFSFENFLSQTYDLYK